MKPVVSKTTCEVDPKKEGVTYALTAVTALATTSLWCVKNPLLG
jgi:hypothetical protein